MVKDLIYKREILSSYYQLSFDLNEENAAAYLHAITDLEVDGNRCKQVSDLWNETTAYKFSNDTSYGGENQFIDFSADCFTEQKEHVVKIYATGYQTLEYIYYTQV